MNGLNHTLESCTAVPHLLLWRKVIKLLYFSSFDSHKQFFNNKIYLFKNKKIVKGFWQETNSEINSLLVHNSPIGRIRNMECLFAKTDSILVYIIEINLYL